MYRMQRATTVLVTENQFESLITINPPEEDNTTAENLQHITIPSALIEKTSAIS